MALSVQQLRKLDPTLGELSDDEVEHLMRWEYLLADAIFDRWLSARSNPHKSPVPLSEGG